MLDRFEKILKPRTPMELAKAVTIFAVRTSLIDRQIEVLKEAKSWRAKTEAYRGQDFCAECQQLIPSGYCRECGLPFPALLPNAFDLLPVAGDAREKLKWIASHLLSLRVSPRLVTALLHSFNETHCKPRLWFHDVQMIFDETVAQELQRRGA